ncbi:MAG: phosphoglycerate dehydrogenase, partial [Candidatus Methylomirabilales bacterium]
MQVLITDDLSPRGLEVLRQNPNIHIALQPRISPEELLTVIDQYEALIVRSATKVTAEVIQAGKRLKVIGRAGVGVDNVDVEAATAQGVVVMNTPTGNTITTAEHTISLLLALAKHVPQAAASLQARRWEKGKFLNVELYNKTLGIIGLGRIGSEVAKRAKGFAMRVIAYDPFISTEVASRIGVELVDLDEVYRQADFVTIHVPLGPDTHHMISRETIGLMKRGVRIINCARGGVLDEEALYEALVSGHVAGAACDVFEKEPATASPLFSLESFIGTPHLGAATAEAQDNVAVAISQQVADFLTTGVIRNSVNTPSIEPEILAKIRPYLTLAEKLGRLNSQLAEGRFREIRIEYTGEVASFDTSPLTASVVKGVLDPIISSTINIVNALPFARQRGIRVVESKSTEEEDYASLISVIIQTDRGQHLAAGTLFSRREPRVVRIDEFSLEAVPEGYLLIFSNLDVPGVIGKIGTLLGQSQVNIAGMVLGREKPGGQAVSVVNVDSPIPTPVLDQIRRIPNIVYAKVVKV